LGTGSKCRTSGRRTDSTVTTDARTDAVDNPGTFDSIITAGADSHFRFKTGSGMFIDLAVGTDAHYFSADLDSDGIVSNASSSLPVQSFDAPGG
jgi:hypothetical protein